MAKFAIRNIKDDSIADAAPVRVFWKEHELGVRVYESPDQPRACDSIHFDLLTRDPLH